MTDTITITDEKGNVHTIDAPLTDADVLTIVRKDSKPRKDKHKRLDRRG